MEIKNDPEIKELDEKTVAYVSFKGNYIGKSEVFKGLIGKLYGWADPKGVITPDSILLSSYQDDPNVIQISIIWCFSGCSSGVFK